MLSHWKKGERHMSYLNTLEQKASETRTLNGAKAYSTTGDACLDLFSVAGGMRYRSPQDQIRLFDRAYIENPELAMKLLFYIRDVRQGMGERQLFRTLIRNVAKNWPESAKKNVRLIPEFGRFDDLFCLLGTKAEMTVVELVRDQLAQDQKALEERSNGNPDAPISLLAKWMPSINTSSARTRGIAQRLMEDLKMDQYSYRKMLSKLRSNTCITERYLTERKPEKIHYSAVPSGAMLKYRQSFKRQDGTRFSAFLQDVSEGKAKIHCETLFPYQILRPYFNSGSRHAANPSGEETLEVLWKHLPRELGNENAISVIDTSGSMYCGFQQNAVTPAMIAISLGLYHAERCKGVFHNHFISFEDRPHLIEVHGDTLQDKLRYIQSTRWGWSTNLEAVFELLLNTAAESHASQDELPSVLYIISDMEFNRAVKNPDVSIYNNAKERFASFGYELPAVVFINVNSWQMQAPVRAHQKGAALASGMGVSTFKEKFDGNMTPMSHMLKVLMSERYEEVHA